MNKIKGIVIYLFVILCIVGCASQTVNEVQSEEEIISIPLEPYRILSANQYTNGRIFNTDYTLIAVPNANGNIYIQEIETGEILYTIETRFAGTAMDVVFSEDNTCVAIMTEMLLQIYDLNAGSYLYEVEFNQPVLYAEFIMDDEFLVIGTGNIADGTINHFNGGMQVSDLVQTIYTYDMTASEYVNKVELSEAECIYGITDDDMYICMDGGENYVTSYSCFDDGVLYNLAPELYQNVSFYPFDCNGEYYTYESINYDYLDIYNIDDVTEVYKFENEIYPQYIGSNQISYNLEDNTTVIHDFVEDVEIATIPVSNTFCSRTIYYVIPETDQYVGFESMEDWTSRFFIYDLSENVKYNSTNSFELRVGMRTLYYLEDRIIVLYADSYGWNAEIYYLNE